MWRPQGVDGQQTKHSLPHSTDSVKTASEVNTCFARFDVRDFRKVCASLYESAVPEQLTLCEADVTSPPQLNPHKASASDGLKHRIIKICATPLGKVFTFLFQLLLDSHSMPRPWKNSTRIRVPKKAPPQQLNEFPPWCSPRNYSNRF